MIKVHHLNQSRSQRVLWALEELSLPYQIERYQRDKTMMAPAALRKVHPLGKSPVLEDNGLILAESGAILEYLQETYDPTSQLKPQDREMNLRSLGKVLGQGVQKAYLNRQLETHARFLESWLKDHRWFAGDNLSMADVQMSFPVFALLERGGIADLPHLQRWMKNVEMRPAWQRAIQQGGPFEIPGKS